VIVIYDRYDSATVIRIVIYDHDDSSIVIYDRNDSITIVIYNRNDSGQYYKTIFQLT